MSRTPSSVMKTYKLRGKSEGVAATMSRNEGSLMKTYKKKGKRDKNATNKLAEAATSMGSEPNEDEVIVNGDEKRKVKAFGTPPMVKQQQKRRRGADAEIAQSYLSSAKKESPPSRFRPRKPVPVFRMVDLGDRDDNRIVGKRVKVYWSGSRRWFTGRIKSFHRRKKLHNVVYEDGDKEDLELRKELFELEILPQEDFKIVRCDEHRRRISEVRRTKGSDIDEDNVASADDDDDNDDGNSGSHQSEGGTISKDDEDGSLEEEEAGDSEEV